MPEGQEVSVEAEDKLTPFEQKIKMNLYDSFFHSQGSAPMQSLLHEYLARQYRTQQPEMSINFGALYEEVLKLRPPKMHHKNSGNDGGTESEFANQFTVLGGLLNIDETRKLPLSTSNSAILISFDPPYSQMADSDLLAEIAQHMLERDSRFIVEGRYDSHTNHDRFRSFLKDYAIDRTPTRSDEFNSLYQKIGESLMNIQGLPEYEAIPAATFTDSRGKKSNLYDSMNSLKAGWEAKHPGLSFFPQHS